MPHYVIHCLDAADTLPRRLEHYEEHKAYLAEAPLHILVSGPLVKDDGKTMIGSFFLVEAKNRAEVEDFNKADPFARNRIWRSVHIHSFIKRVDNR